MKNQLYLFENNKKVCKDGRILGQNNKEAGNHLGILISRKYIKKGWNPNSIGKHFKKGREHPDWKGGISFDPEYDKKRYCGERRRKHLEQGRNRTRNENKEQLIKKYGINIDQFNEMLKKQNNVCAICGQPEIRRYKSHGKEGICYLHIDHNHNTQKVRGLLCSKCNLGISNFLENTEIMLKAIKYLKKGG